MGTGKGFTAKMFKASALMAVILINSPQYWESKAREHRGPPLAGFVPRENQSIGAEVEMAYVAMTRSQWRW